MKTRYGITYINNAGFRQLIGRNIASSFEDTHEAAQKRVKSMIQNNSAELLADIFGPSPKTLDVSSFECHDHGEAVAVFCGRYFPEHDYVSSPGDKVKLAKIFNAKSK